MNILSQLILAQDAQITELQRHIQILYGIIFLLVLGLSLIFIRYMYTRVADTDEDNSPN